jgi:hypothetical protein
MENSQLKVWFSSWIDTLLRYYSSHNMSNLNKFQDSYQNFKKNLRPCLLRKKKFKDA